METNNNIHPDYSEENEIHDINEMRHQWELLQNKLNDQKELSRTLLSKSARSHSRWLITYLRLMTAFSFIFGLPACAYLNKIGLNDNVSVFLAVVIAIQGVVMLIESFLIPNPSDLSKNVMEINDAIIRFRKIYIADMIFGILCILTAAIWCFTLDFEWSPVIIGAITGGVIGIIIGISFDKRALRQAKGRKEDIQVLQNWKN